MLRRMFTDHNRPFYKSAVTIHIDKSPVDESVRFVVDRFASDGKAIARETAEQLVAKVENIPFAEKRPQSDVASPQGGSVAPRRNGYSWISVGIHAYS